ncbi:MAG: DUF1501 domain-containing protein [Candidatus Kapabacteria bacterium]|jgi:uncharacterized protein (DUF1501 family)|nr:DUF1501 domain-containing protein [Candidatus Kapabacteria bacterium]
MMNRRTFLKSSGLAVVALGASGTPFFLTQTAASTLDKPFKRKKILVTIFQRGAMDGLMAVTPFTDPNLASARPRLAMQIGKNKGQLVDLDGKFALHPAFAPLEALFREQHLAIVHGMGSPNTTRSHFDAQDYMETGTPDRKGTPSGWLNRVETLLQSKSPKAETTPFSAVAMTSAMPRSLYGDAPALAIARLEDFGVRVGGQNMAAATLAQSSGKGFEALYEQTSQKILRGAGQESFDAIKILSESNFKSYTPSKGANYPVSPLGDSLKQIAQLIKANVGLEIAFAESGGWDTHVQQGTINGVFSRRAQDLADAIAAFWRDIEPFRDDVVLMTMTEFGRTVSENGSGGTDHGRGSCLFVLGNDVQGGVVYGNVPTLVPENLADGRDVPVTTDFRGIFSAVASGHLGITETAKLFPGWTGEALKMMKV